MMERLLPSYPLFVKDPYFSIWSPSEVLNESVVETWWAEKKPMFGFLKTAGKTYCFLGNANFVAPFGVEKAQQTALSVSAFSTDYEFKAGDAVLKLRFVSPLPLDDPELLAMPVCYMEYEVQGATDAEISLFVASNLCVNNLNPNKVVRAGVVPFKGFKAAVMGLQRQLPISNQDDQMGADWGYWYLSGEQAYYVDERGFGAYLVGGNIPQSWGTSGYVASVNKQQSGAIMLGYDDVVSIDYFGDYLKGYYLENHTIIDALNYVHENRTKINAQLDEFEKNLKKQNKYGAAYENVLNASLRQAIAAHKLVRDRKGRVLFLSKECNSNGCIGTVDVSYPSIPLFLLYDTEYVKGMMRPILDFAKMPVWTYDFAPHDVGTYPCCCGQVYGLNWDKVASHGPLFNKWEGGERLSTQFPVYLLPGESDVFLHRMQMPVEECANMLVMFLACYEKDGDIEFFKNDLALCEKWVEYLVKFGLKPDDQLCTDDFAGHLKNNLNLAIKATVGIAAYAKLVGLCGKKETEEKYRKIAEDFAAEITAFAGKFSHMPLTWDSGEETFSLKYNFAFDKLLGLNLFPQSLFESEVSYYVEKCNAYGTPLDTRATYTKSDWLMWVAALTEDENKRAVLVNALDRYLRETPDRVPFGDWYFTDDGKYRHFRARTVQGGCFILLLRK